jgi:hypothetical protein
VSFFALDYCALPNPIAAWGDFFVSVFDPAQLKHEWERAVSDGVGVEFADPRFETIVKNAKSDSNPALAFFRLKQACRLSALF